MKPQSRHCSIVEDEVAAADEPSIYRNKIYKSETESLFFVCSMSQNRIDSSIDASRLYNSTNMVVNALCQRPVYESLVNILLDVGHTSFSFNNTGVRANEIVCSLRTTCSSFRANDYWKRALILSVPSHKMDEFPFSVFGNASSRLTKSKPI